MSELLLYIVDNGKIITLSTKDRGVPRTRPVGSILLLEHRAVSPQGGVCGGHQALFVDNVIILRVSNLPRSPWRLFSAAARHDACPAPAATLARSQAGY